MTVELNIQDLDIAVPQEPGTELSAVLESDAPRGDPYLGSADSDGVEQEKKVFTDSKVGRSRKDSGIESM